MRRLALISSTSLLCLVTSCGDPTPPPAAATAPSSEGRRDAGEHTEPGPGSAVTTSGEPSPVVKADPEAGPLVVEKVPGGDAGTPGEGSGTPAPAAEGATGEGGSQDAAGLAVADPGLPSGPASDADVAKARAIEGDVACLRGLPFRQPVAIQNQSRADFRTYVETEITREVEKGELGREQRLLKAIGAIADDVDLRAVMLEASVGQAAAYYEPKLDTFYIVATMPEFLLKSVMAHELHHALQDQHTKLLSKYVEGGFDSLDQSLALRFLVEGDATLVGNAWLVADMSMSMIGGAAPRPCSLPGQRADDASLEAFWGALGDIVTGSANQTREQVENPGLLATLATTAMSPSAADSMKQLPKLPHYVFYSLLWPYNKGQKTVYDVLVASNHRWSAVDALYVRPPTSTEQVLHPEKLGTKRELFAKFDAPKAPPGSEDEGWTYDKVERAGELVTFVVLREGGLDEKTAAAAAAGWNGDALRVAWREHEGETQLAFTWRLAWDDAAEATEARRAFAEVLAKRRSLPAGALDPFAKPVERGAAKGSASFIGWGWADASGQARSGGVRWGDTWFEIHDGWASPVVAAP